MEFLLVILICLATFRITRLITRDKLPLIDLPREAFVQRWGAYQDTQRVRVADTWRWWRYFWAGEFESVDGKHQTNLVMKSLAYLWECDWCTSVWVGAGVVYTSTIFVDVPYPFLVWLAASAVTGLIAERESRSESSAV